GLRLVPRLLRSCAPRAFWARDLLCVSRIADAHTRRPGRLWFLSLGSVRRRATALRCRFLERELSNNCHSERMRPASSEESAFRFFASLLLCFLASLPHTFHVNPVRSNHPVHMNQTLICTSRRKLLLAQLVSILHAHRVRLPQRNMAR